MIQFGGKEFIEPIRLTLHLDAIGEPRVLIEHHEWGQLADPTIDEIADIAGKLVDWIAAQQRSASQRRLAP